MRRRSTARRRCTGRCGRTTWKLTDLLLRAGAKVSAANQSGATPMQLAAMNGNAAMIERLIKAGADPNAPLSKTGDTALMMAARTGKIDAVKVLLDHGAQVNAKETWGGTTALMWAVSERHPEVVKLLIDRGADVNAKSNFVPSASGRGFEGTTPVAPKPDQTMEEFASGWLTPLMFAAREDDLESARILVAAGADVNAVGGDGKDALALALFNGSYDVASFLIDSHANVNQADAQRFTPLFWAVDRRNMETAPNFPWMVTTDPLPLIKKLLDAGAEPERSGEQHAPGPHARGLAADRVRHGADARGIRRRSRAGEAAARSWRRSPHRIPRPRDHADGGLRHWRSSTAITGRRPPAERLEVVKLLVDLGEDVNAADDYGITPLMVAANLGDINIVQVPDRQGRGPRRARSWQEERRRVRLERRAADAASTMRSASGRSCRTTP